MPDRFKPTRLDRHSRLHHCGFTAIELLVVISIVAVLLSLLLPAVSRARETAQMVQCSAKMRTLGMWATQFASLYKYYPRAQSSDTPLNANWYPYVTHGVNGGTGYVYNWQSMLSDMVQSTNSIGPTASTTNKDAYQIAQDPAYFGDVAGVPVGSRSIAYGMNLLAGGGFDYGSHYGLTGSSTSGQWVPLAEDLSTGLPTKNPGYGPFVTAERVQGRDRILFVDADSGYPTLNMYASTNIVAGKYGPTWSATAPGHAGGNAGLVFNNVCPVISYRHLSPTYAVTAGSCSYDGNPISSYAGRANVCWVDGHVGSYSGTSSYHTYTTPATSGSALPPASCSGDVPLDSSSWCPMLN